MRRIVIVPDTDDTGRAHAQAVARSCAAAGIDVKVAALPAGIKDVSAYVDAGHERRALLELVKRAEPYDEATDRQALPAGLVRLSDADLDTTPADGPPPVARLLAHAGRVTLLHAREKTGKSTLIGAAIAAVTRGRPFLAMPTVCGDVLWVGEEAAADVKSRLSQWDADLGKVYFIRQPRPDPEHESSLRRLVERVRPVWVILDTSTTAGTKRHWTNEARAEPNTPPPRPDPEQDVPPVRPERSWRRAECPAVHAERTDGRRANAVIGVSITRTAVTVAREPGADTDINAPSRRPSPSRRAAASENPAR